MILSQHSIIQSIKLPSFILGIQIELQSNSEDVWLYNKNTNTYSSGNLTPFAHNGAGPVHMAMSKNLDLMICSVNSGLNAPVGLFSIDKGQNWSYIPRTENYWWGSAVSDDGNVGLVTRGHTNRGYMLTTNGGTSWSYSTFPSFSGQPWNIWGNYDLNFVMIPTNGSVLALWHNRSTIYTRTLPVNNCMESWSVKSAVYTTTDPERIWVCPTSGSGVYYSDNMGSSWTASSLGTTFTYSKISGSEDASVLYAMTYNGNAPVTGKLFKSLNQGASWTEITPSGHSGGFHVYQGSMCDHTGQYLFVGKISTSQVYYSDDYGATWLLTDSGGTFGYGVSIQKESII